MDGKSWDMSDRFSTRSVPATHRLAFWNDLASAIYGPLVVDSAEREAFDADVARIQIGACELTSARSSPATVHSLRSSRAPQAIHLQLQYAGGSTTSHEGRVADLGVGDFALFDAARPFNSRFTSPTHVLILSLPRAELFERGIDLEPYLGLTVKGNRGPGGMLSAFLRSAWPRGDLDFDENWSQTVSEVLFSLIKLVYPRPAPSAQTENRSRRFQARAFRIIDSQLCDPTFTVAKLGSKLGVSARSVQMAFAHLGVTPSQYILRRRLELAAKRLGEAGKQARISEIAFSLGFNDLSYFCRAFRRLHGVSPRSYRGG